ncbi:unnamed protein product [Dibothriocephalus latus]|uniref:Retrotransposon gag domain-containing protein n=1 Tax=Dibothriocephalus latus TaxID=60516 RepID=A0A3P7LXQ1_DIBLA|nr:unnamed protein product [Dibothriocephalus latus]
MPTSTSLACYNGGRRCRIPPNPPGYPPRNHEFLPFYRRPDPLLAPTPYQSGQDIPDLPPSDHTRYLLNFLSPETLDSVLEAGITIDTPFPIAHDQLLSLFGKPISESAAGAQFYQLEQTPQRSAMEFAKELQRLGRLAYPITPPMSRDQIVLDRFIAGLRDRAVTEHLVISRSLNLTAALQIFNRLTEFRSQEEKRKVTVPAPSRSSLVVIFNPSPNGRQETPTRPVPKSQPAVSILFSLRSPGTAMWT